MIISRAPLRLPLGGGGVDLPEYYSKRGAFWLSGAINRHIYIIFHSRSIYSGVKLKYSKVEEVENISQIEHPIFRTVLQKYGIRSNVEITSIADVAAGTGLGSSSTFTVALLNAIHSHNKKSVSLHDLAEEAFDIEVNQLNLGAGKQDMYSATLGDIRAYTADKKGNVSVERLNLDAETTQQVEQNLLLFFTGKTRKTGALLYEQNQKIKNKDPVALQAMDALKAIALRTKKELLAKNVDELGPLLDQHWAIKKVAFPSISTPQIDAWYALAKKNGATGGKISGAGAGGFLILYSPTPEKQKNLRKALTAAGLIEMRYLFDPVGVKTLFNIEGTEWY